MKNKIHTFVLLLVFLFNVSNLFAYDFEVNGIFYNHIGKDLDVAVTECDGKYSGNITIPAEVLYDNTKYNVVAIEDEAFWGCYGLTSIIITEGISRIGKSAFRYCSHIASITIPESMESIGEYAFDGCSSLITINLPKSIKRIPHYLFRGCESLDNITLPKDVNFIGNEAFSGCASLSSIAIPEGISSFGNETFRGCTSIHSFVFPKNTKVISTGMFSGCTKLKEITIPEGVNEIRTNAFYGCVALTDFYCHTKEIPTTELDIFERSKIENATLHVPYQSMEEYKIIVPWQNFGTIKALSDEETDVKTITEKNMKIFSSGGKVTITGLGNNRNIRCYSVDGTLLKNLNRKNGNVEFVAKSGDIVIISVEDKSFKTIVK